MNIKKIIAVILMITVIGICSSGSLLADDKRVVTDMTGRKVKLPDEVDRVVTTYTPATQFVMALGAADRLVSGAGGMPLQLLFTLIDEDINQLPEVGSKSGINLEAVLSADPDLVITDPHGSGPQAAEKLKKQGIPTIIIKPESLTQIKEANNLIGKALNLEDRANKINKQYDKILKLTERTRDLSVDERKKVYFANSSFLNTVGEDMLQTDLIRLAGGVNPARKVKKGFIETSAEQLIKWNPNTVIVSQFYRNKIEELLKSPKYQSLKAFKEKSVYRIPSQLEPWDYPGPSSPLLTIWLAKKIYPEEYSDVDVDHVINQFYKNVYGKTFDQFKAEIE